MYIDAYMVNINDLAYYGSWCGHAPEADAYIILRSKNKHTPAVRSRISSKIIFASCVPYSDRAYYWACVLIKDLRR